MKQKRHSKRIKTNKTSKEQKKILYYYIGGFFLVIIGLSLLALLLKLYVE